MNPDAGFTLVEFLLFLILGLIVVWLATLEWRLLRTTRTMRMLFSGRAGADLEQMLRDYIQRMDRADETIKTLSTRLDQTVSGLTNRTAALEGKLPASIQHVGVVRYNPFPDKGGDQSFVVALLDGHSDGVVLSGLHTRSDVRVYAKPVVGGNSTYPMTEEEKEAVKRALGQR